MHRMPGTKGAKERKGKSTGRSRSAQRLTPKGSKGGKVGASGKRLLAAVDEDESAARDAGGGTFSFSEQGWVGGTKEAGLVKSRSGRVGAAAGAAGGANSGAGGRSPDDEPG